MQATEIMIALKCGGTLKLLCIMRCILELTSVAVRLWTVW